MDEGPPDGPEFVWPESELGWAFRARIGLLGALGLSLPALNSPAARSWIAGALGLVGRSRYWISYGTLFLSVFLFVSMIVVALHGFMREAHRQATIGLRLRELTEDALQRLRAEEIRPERVGLIRAELKRRGSKGT